MKNEIHILIIDDDKVSRYAIYNKLEHSCNNFILHEAETGAEAIELLIDLSIDCIILDYLLTDITGLDLLHRFKEINVLVPAIMLTSEGDETIAVQAIKAGAYDYLPKNSLRDSEFTDRISLSIMNAIHEHSVEIEKARSRIALEMSEERYRGLIENSPILILRFFPDDFMICFVNDGYCNYFNMERFEVMGESLFSFILEEHRDKIKEKILALNFENPIGKFEMSIKTFNGLKWQIWTCQSIFNEDGSIIEYQCMGEDITEMKLAEAELIRQKRYLQSILDSQDNLIIVATRERVIQVNISFLNFFGYRISDDFFNNIQKIFEYSIDTENYKTILKGKNWLDQLLEESDRENLISFMPEGVESPRIFSITLSRLSIEEETYVVEFSDVTGIEEKKKDFEQKATFDPLTMVYNRRKFDEMLLQMIEVSKRYKTYLSLVYFDIDHFKKVNDEYGHQAGDSVLVELSALVKTIVRKADVFARWGGEEFIILAPESDLKSAVSFAEKIRKAIEAFKFKYVEHVTCSFGVAEFNKNDSDESFVNRADKGLYSAKESGRNRVVAVKKK